MRNLLVGLWLGATILSLPPASAQPADPSVESVTVNGRRVADEEIKAFVASRVAPTFKLGKVARWQKDICPTVMGLDSSFTSFVLQRVKEIAVQAGAPVDANTHCKPDLQIVFTTKPQELLDNIRRNFNPLLGYHDNNAQAQQMAKVTHPIQAWYSTATVDVRGVPHFDGAKIPGIGCVDMPKCRLNLSYASALPITGDRVRDGLSSGFHDVIIVVQPEKLAGYEIGALADYIAFMALTQPRSQDDCQRLPTILNLLAAGCPAADTTTRMTDSDLGYLRGIYHMSKDSDLTVQQNEIAYQVKQALQDRH